MVSEVIQHGICGQEAERMVANAIRGTQCVAAVMEVTRDTIVHYIESGATNLRYSQVQKVKIQVERRVAVKPPLIMGHSMTIVVLVLLGEDTTEDAQSRIKKGVRRAIMAMDGVTVTSENY